MEYKTFKEYDIQIGSLLEDIKNGKVGLPDLQRPFVWRDAKVRDLLDSMMRGYPIGYIMTWGAPKDYGKTRTIGDNDKCFDEPKDLIIDGQQRLTSLIAALYGISVVDARGSKRNITISYNPLTAKFEVRDAATIKSNQYINEIKDVFTADYEHTIPQLRRALIDRLNSRRERFGQQRLSESEEDLIERNINRLLDIKKYTIHVIELTSDANEEDVAEIFSRGTDPKR